MFRAVNNKAEQAFLGTLLNYPDTLFEIIDMDEDVFGDIRNRSLLATIKKHPDSLSSIVLLIEALKEEKLWTYESNKNGHCDMEFLSSLQEQGGVPAQIKVYWGLIYDAYRQRRLISHAKGMLGNLGDAFLTRDELKDKEDEWVKLSYSIMADVPSSSMESFHEIFRQLLKPNNDRTFSPTPTMIKKLDMMTSGGFRPGESIVLAGRPSDGKTSLALSIVASICDHYPCIVFSLEMDRSQIVSRLLSIESGVTLQDIRNKNFLTLDYQRDQIRKAERRMANWQIWIDDEFTATTTDIRNKVLKITQRERFQPRLVVVDYLQLIKPEKSKDSREQQISAISRGIKSMARDLKFPVLLLSQLNRQSVADVKSKPQLHHLRESGAIEQDADVVLAIHKDRKDSPDVDICILKQRNGPIGDISLYWEPTCTRFSQKEAVL